MEKKSIEKVREKGKENLKKLVEIYFEDVLPFIEEIKEEIYEFIANSELVHKKYVRGDEDTRKKFRLPIPEIMTKGVLSGYTYEIIKEGQLDEDYTQVNTIYTRNNEKIKNEAIMLPFRDSDGFIDSFILDTDKVNNKVEISEDEKKIEKTFHYFLQESKKLIESGKEVYPGAIIICHYPRYGTYLSTRSINVIPTLMRIPITGDFHKNAKFYFFGEITKKNKKIIGMKFSDSGGYYSNSYDRTAQLISYGILEKAADYFSKRAYKTRGLESLVDALRWDESIEISKLKKIMLEKKER